MNGKMTSLAKGGTRLRARFLCGICMGVALLACIAMPASAETQVIHAGWLLATPGERPLRERTVIVRDGRVDSVLQGYVAAAEVEEGARLIDLSRQYVLPGMIDLHSHITMRLFQPRPNRFADLIMLQPADEALRATASARQILMSGFTTIRDLGASHDVIFPLRDAVQKGLIPGPRIIAAGSNLSRTGGHGDLRMLRPEVRQLWRDRDRQCSGAAACRQGVRERVADGADVIKISVSGSASDDTGDRYAESDLLPDELEAIVRTARSLGRRVAAHATSTKGINAAVRAGVNTIDHGSHADDSSFELMRDAGVILVPTAYVTVFLDRPEIRSGLSAEEWGFLSEAIKQARGLPGRAYRAGVKLGLGTDAGGDLEANRAEELQLYVESGVPAAEAVKAATSNSAEALGMGDKLGRIQPGYIADIIAVDGDPTDDVRHLYSVGFVMKEGRVHKVDGEMVLR